MKRIKRWLACLLITAMVLPLCCVQTALADVSKDEDRDYVRNVLDNYADYLEITENSYWLRLDERYHYELLAQKMIDASFSRKLDLDTAFDAMNEKLTVEDCVKYLNTVMIMIENGMSDNVKSLAQHDFSKEAMSYLEDFFALSGNIVGVEDPVGAAKRVQKMLGFSADTLDYLLKERDGIEGLMTVLQEYQINDRFLRVIADNTKYPEMKQAANILLGVYSCQLSFALENRKAQLQAGKNFAWASTRTMVQDGFVQWITANEKILNKKWPWGQYISVSELGGMVKALNAWCVAFRTGAQLGVLLGDIYIGNEYRYLKEIMMMDDIAQALQVGIEVADPTRTDDEEEQAQWILYQTSLLQALCVVRTRGEYCANMMAQANDTLFDVLFVWKNKEDEMTKILEEDMAYLQEEYRLLSEIFMMDDFVISLVWNNVEENTYLSNGALFSNVQISYPEVSYPNDNDADKKITAYLKNQALAVKNGVLDVFGWEGANAKYWYAGEDFNMATLYFDGNQRMDQLVISVVEGVSHYKAGNTRGLYGLRAYNFDTQSGELLTVWNLIRDAQSYDDLCNLVYRYLDPEKVKENEIREAARTVLQQHSWTSDCYEDWYFTANGLCIVFENYLIAPGSYGMLKAEIPYGELQGIVEDKYLHPNARTTKGTDIHGELVETANISRADNIYFCEVPGDKGYTIQLSSEEMVYDVTVYECATMKSEESRVYSELPLVSLGTLSPESVIFVECGVSDPDVPTLKVCWVDGTGRERMSRFGVNSSGRLIEEMVE